MALRKAFRCANFKFSSLNSYSKFFYLSTCLQKNWFTTALSMKTIYFHNDAGDEKLYVQFLFQNSAYKINKTLSFERNMSETIDKFLHRLNTRLLQVFERKEKKFFSTDEHQINKISECHPMLFFNNEPLANETVFRDILNENKYKSLKLKILDDEYNVLFNYPAVTDIALPSYLRIECPVYPEKFVAKCVDEDQCEFKWYKKKSNQKQWIFCGTGYSYIPTDEDLDCLIKLSCTPKNNMVEGPTCEVISSKNVEPFENANIIKKRHKYTSTKTGNDEFRIVTYNILADIYVNTKEAKTVLFKCCKPDILKFNYRFGLMILEMLGYKADLICLQEVDKKCFKNYLYPLLKNKEYMGVFHQKEINKEGCAFFFNTNKFKLLNVKQHIFNEEIKENPILSDIKKSISDNSKLQGRLNGIQNQLQVAVVECLVRQADILVIGNTHLYFHPDADHIRLLQGIIAFKLLLQTVEDMKQKHPDKNVSLLFCGDLNSTPDCGIYKLMTEGSVSNTEPDWKSNSEETINNVSFNHLLSIQSACGTPIYTNYTETFKECLDYIYYQTDRLELKQAVPVPSEEDLSKEVAIPSSYFPSDHIAQVADLKWKP